MNLRLPLFRVGALVRMRSGGPQMTVTTVETRVAECCWYDRARGCFGVISLPCAALQAVPEALDAQRRRVARKRKA